MEICAVFEERFPHVKTERNFSFSSHTTIGCGGTAEIAVSPESAREAAEILSFLIENAIPYCFLGAGANVLPADGFWQGAVIRFHRLKHLKRCGKTIFAGAGITGSELLGFAVENAIGGFEPFAGIPMTVGGAAAMNAGIAERHFSDLVLRVEGVENGVLRTFSHEECCYGEKSSVFLSGLAVTGVWLKAEKSDLGRIRQNIQTYLARRARLPKGKSMGCTFVNPAEIPAGKLIDECGLKGRKVGGAYVSEEHANFILNDGGSYSDVAELIALIKTEVLKKTGVSLREEIRRIP